MLERLAPNRDPKTDGTAAKSFNASTRIAHENPALCFLDAKEEPIGASFLALCQ